MMIYVSVFLCCEKNVSTRVPMAWCGFNIQNNIKLLLFPANTSSQADAMVEMIICGVGYRNTVL